MKTTKAQFDFYAKRVRHWAEKYGLHNVHFGIVNEHFPGDDEEEADATLGWASFDQEGGLAVVGLNPDAGEEASQTRLDRVAFHEVWEVLLWPMREIMEGRGVERQIVSAKVHDIIRRAETAQFGF